MSRLRSASIVLLVTAASCGAAASAQAADAPVRLRVPVAVCDAQSTPPEILASAEQVVSDVYRAIGVAIEWTGAVCPAAAQGLTLNMIARDASGLTVTNETLGFAEPGTPAA